MSTINTNGLDVNYPIPGQNNSSQGFRNNFTNIKTNLDIASDEITDLQNNVVLKSALANSTINNDMANTLISNASTLGFRATTYNLGNALTGTVVINCALGDVQYGNLAGNVVLQFGSWAPTGTQSKLQLQLGRASANANSNYTISFPAEAIVDKNHGFTILENYSYPNNVSTLTFPYNVTQLNLTLTSNDCGNTIFVEPTNRPFKATQIQQRTPPSTGEPGDTVGTFCVDINGSAQLLANSLSNDFFITSNTSSLSVGTPVIFSAYNATVSTEANITLGNTYYVSNIANSTAFKVSDSAALSSNVNLAGNVSQMKVNPVQYMYVAVADFSANVNDAINITSTTSPNLIVLDSFTNVANNNPIIFTGNGTGNTTGLESNKVYYIKNAWSGNSTITISEFRYNGIASVEYQEVQSATGNLDVSDATTYNGSDIFRRTTLNPF